MTEFSGSKRVKLWGGRFIGSTDPVMEEFNASISYDKAMWKEDIQGSSAYAAALRKANLLTEQECLKLTENLQKIHDEWNSGTFSIKSGDEDIHTANERRLKELAGEVGGKVHTGRSRNDQVAVDMRMWLRGHVEQLSSYICNLVKVCLYCIVDRGYLSLFYVVLLRYFLWYSPGDVEQTSILIFPAYHKRPLKGISLDGRIPYSFVCMIYETT
ncbi:glutamate N-acetyltransferase [Halocaridina rubra]|uniref:Glutamate N-acetyltransferase n=1 Tax=Halocaridina rubra TaxID=373956 RepID=A0AAN9AAB4_HALRR